MKDFESQFNTKKEVSFHGHTVSFVEIVPVGSLKSETPLFIAPGWGETPKIFKNLMRLLFDEGFRVISMAHPRHDLKLITTQSISRYEYQKAEAIAAVIDFLAVKKVYAIAHSEGAINAVIAAHLHPEKFEGMFLVGPGGFVESESFGELLVRFFGNMVQSGLRAFGDSAARASFFQSGKELMRYFFTNPTLSLLEGSAISRTHLYDFLLDLHQKNISVSVMEGTRDIVFPVRKMKLIAGLQWIDFHSISGGHNDICIHPENYTPYILKRFETASK